MTRTILFSLLLTAAATVAAESRWFGNMGGDDDTETVFQETELPLPPVPDTAQSGWFELYVSPMYRGQALILPDSITVADDRTIRYVLNRRSAAGYDNLTAEGLYCFTGNRLLGSDGAQVKTFAYADTTSGRWMQPRRAQWQVIGGKHNGIDPVRGVLYEVFCVDGRADADTLRQRLRRSGGLSGRRENDK